jgi:hypothetical protein
MADKKLVDWINSQKSKGYAEEQIIEVLVKKGYSNGIIKKAIKETNEEITNISIKEILNPNFFKLFIPMLLCIIIISSFYFNSVYLPRLASISIEINRFSEEYNKVEKETIQKIRINNIDPYYMKGLLEEKDKKLQEILLEVITLKKEQHNIFSKVILANLFMPLIYTIDPLFPILCENELSPYFEKYKIRKCQFYINQNDYELIKQYSNSEVWSGIFFGNWRGPYEEISFPTILFHTILIFIIIYFTICFLYFLNLKLKKAKLNVRVVVVCSGILIISLSCFFKIYLSILLIPFTIFSIFSFLKEKKLQKIVLILLIIISLIVIVTGTYWVYLSFNKDSKNILTYDLPQYSILNCENTTNLTYNQKQKTGIPRELINETWKMCNFEYCSRNCNCSSNTSKRLGRSVQFLRGDNPSCICGCFKVD